MPEHVNLPRRAFVTAGLSAAAGALAASHTAATQPAAARTGARTGTFPPRFLWGTATAAHQVEGNSVNSRSLLDNSEWIFGYRPTFGLVAVDRTTFERTEKPSARYLGGIARANAL